jgi:Acetyl-coenzyme A synthetase N-terminus
MNTSPATDNKFGEVLSTKEYQAKKARCPMKSSAYGDLYNWSVTDPTSFWQAQAEAIHWQTPFHTVCDFTNPPFARWFVGGKTNLCYNAVDRHLETRANQPAIFFHSSEMGTEKVITYRQLHHEVTRFSAVLKMLGIIQGRSGGYLSTDDSGSSLRHASLRQNWSDSFRRVCRIRRQQPGDSDRRCPSEVSDNGRCSDASRHH